MKINDFLLDELHCQAKKSDVMHKHAAALMKGKRAVSIGFNKYKGESQPAQQTVHAEESVLNACLSGHFDLIVIRIGNGKNEQFKLSRPCNNCIDRMMTSKGLVINKVYYSDENGEIIFEYLKLMKKLHVSKAWRGASPNTRLSYDKN